MKKLKQMLFGVVAALAFVSVAGLVPAQAETIKKLHTAGQQVISASGTDYVGDVSSTTLTVDLSGGDLDKVSVAISITSGTSTGTPTFDCDIEGSPDGGTSWGVLGSFTQITSTTSVNAANPMVVFKQNLATGPCTKLRLRILGSANTTWHKVKAWVMPSVD